MHERGVNVLLDILASIMLSLSVQKPRKFKFEEELDCFQCFVTHLALLVFYEVRRFHVQISNGENALLTYVKVCLFVHIFMSRFV